MNFMSYVAEVSRGWDEPNDRDMGRMTSQPNAKGGIYVLSEDMDMKAKLATDSSLAAAVAMAPFDSRFDPRQRRHLIHAQLLSQLIRVQLVLLG